MGQTTDEIKSHIESKREELRSNFEELEDRVRSAADWRRHFRNNPGVALGLAFGGGLLLASMFGGARAPGAETYEPAEATRRAGGTGKRQMLHAWENIQSALIGVAASKVGDTLSQVLPGFRDHLKRSEGAGHAREATPSGNGVQGEGDYRAARRYRAGAEKFAQTADVERAARNAAPRNAAESEELAQAEAEGRARAKRS
jgi:hypothetical protein